ncbi:branched-chain amino acid ABC transporter permease [Geothermobacter hydrogeniphilus]|uniref:Branched-chain amino acid ABC transporter permease n=1 Tax=Geothermobacter hydrogeniphilus TaxID=1969733 RepID=A0A1X0Y0K3_9BACT|nr:branched-chain amino acid ABC transporter permease [Geothermobacter hydrogeniphilus]ORJ58602.1 branched-chain amino acid ABC transporter permease [Geothermobacter hydrogeniphilus]PNU19735.1 branched-chain amino acid ABC transporter permease [Geothermobacter hydrogeniphilus]
MKQLQRLGYPLFLGVMAVLPHLLNSRWQAVAITFLIFSVVALSQDIVLGKSGMFNMGQALFFGMGAYTTAILNHQFGWSLLATIPLAILLPALFGIILAGPIVHLRGDYLLVTTIGFNIVFVQVLQNNLGGITGGPNGIFGLDSMSLFGWQLTSQVAVYYFAFAVLLATLWVMHNLEKSKAGRALHYLREDQLAAESIGINTRVYKIFAFGLGAGIAGLAGTVYATQYSAVSPEAFDFIQSVLFFSIVIVGGSSVPGVLLGVFVMFVLPEIFREFATWRFFIFGFAMILSMILRPRGIVPATFGKIPKFLIKDGSHGA